VIQGIANISHLYQHFISPNMAQRRVTVPVTPIMSGTAVFKHVLGVPARGDTQGIPVFKLRVLDSMIERLVSAGSKRINPMSFETVREIGVDRLIGSLEQKVHVMESQPFYKPTPVPGTGTLINILV